MSDKVLAAINTGGFGLLGAMLGYLVKMTRSDHGKTTANLSELLRGHNRIENKLDRHINDHAKGDV
jgi:hypothetical protein